MEGKKISFSFIKTKKVDKPVTQYDEKKEYIECVEEQSIKIVGGENVAINKPLVIPMKPNTLITPSRLREIAEKVESALVEPEIKVEHDSNVKMVKPLSENETLDEMAVRELIAEAKKEIKIEPSAMAIPTPANIIPEGDKESTLDDYDAVPIQEFGVALLRGMGWTPSNNSPKYKQPELRPKGLGLGADKVIKQKNPTSKDNKTEELEIVKTALVKITSGKYANCYGKVVGLDEENGRVMVDIPIKKETVNLSEFMMQAVTKSEYEKEHKVINSDAYEEYKKNQLSHTLRHEEKSSSSQSRLEKSREENDWKIETGNNKEKNNESSNGKSRNRRRDSSSSEDRFSRKKKSHKKKRSSSCESLSSVSEDDRRQYKNKTKNRRSRSKSNPRKRTPEGKRDIDKKRKGKKKKRDRDRSPNYKKYRK